MNFELERCHKADIDLTVERDHYLHRWPDPRSLPFGYQLRFDGSDHAQDGRPWGLLVFKKPQHHKQRGLFGYPGLPTAWQVLDLARVWVHPVLQQITFRGCDREGSISYHKLCVFSRMVGMAMRRLNDDWLRHHPPVFPEQPYNIRVVISYCDHSHHDGTGYRASGFARFGTSNDGTKEVYLRRLFGRSRLSALHSPLSASV